MKEEWKDFKELLRENRTWDEIERTSIAKHRLVEMGCDVTDGHDKTLNVVFPNGSRFQFWPYTGWFNRIGGPKRRPKDRGLKALIRNGKDPA